MLYFVAEVEGILQIDGEEIVEAKWVAIHNAEQYITFSESQGIMKQVISQLTLIS